MVLSLTLPRRHSTVAIGYFLVVAGLFFLLQEAGHLTEEEDELEAERILGDDEAHAIVPVARIQSGLARPQDAPPYSRTLAEAAPTGIPFLARDPWSNDELRVYVRDERGSVYSHPAAAHELLPPLTPAQLAAYEERRVRWLRSTAPCPRCGHRIRPENAGAHAREHCPVQDCAYDRRRPPLRRLRKERELFARHMFTHVLERFLDLHGIVVPDATFIALVQMWDRSHAAFVKALMKILRREGLVVSIAERETPCSTCGTPLRPGDLELLIPRKGWAHLICSHHQTSALPDKG